MEFCYVVVYVKMSDLKSLSQFRGFKRFPNCYHVAFTII